MAPRRQAAVAAQASMADIAARETEVDNDTPIKPPKAPKVLKPAKVSKKSQPSQAKNAGKGSNAKAAVKKSSDVKFSDGSSIPLLCCICSSHPRFSDVSHLLTHLSSKGHLHTLNTTRLESHADLSAAATIATYDTWYAKHNLERLLAERLMAARGMTNGRRPGQHLAQTVKKKKSLAVTVKTEHDADAPSTPSAKKTGSFEHQEAITFFGEEGEPADPGPDYVEEDYDTVRLKGIIWPGMSLFDAATPDQRKKRNQRKDASVLLQMELDSQAVTTLEMVANLNLEVEKTRSVYDAPSIEGTPPAKKPRGRQRRAVTDGFESPSVRVKEELDTDDEALMRPTRARQLRTKKGPKVMTSPSPEADFQNSPERFEIASDDADVSDPNQGFVLGTDMPLGIAYNDNPHGDVDADNDPDPDSFDTDFDESQFVDQMGNFKRTFTIPDRPDVGAGDVFRDGSSDPRQPPTQITDQARFNVRSRIPLQPMNPNSNLTLASPTPAAKQLSHRTYKGKENNCGLQDPAFGNHSFFGGHNAHLNQARMSNMGMPPPFHNFAHAQAIDSVFHPHYPHHWPHNAHHGFNPINGHPDQRNLYHPHMFPIAPNVFDENDPGQGLDGGFNGNF
ncbi:unnamed protein product [Colletotrichum noveboracense]|uniref:Uncharacterized protein n=1 Tax=Colletotrichum noveboracense TaxID=2664923 RepID=A0A9W4WCN5_9PEZI|nr:unnamed protein product [Colletotrichum noveboracense]